MINTQYSAGFTLTELLVAASLSAAIIAGSLTAFSGTLQSYRDVEAQLELQDRATFALRAMVADLQLAGLRTPPPGRPAVRPVNASCAGTDVTAWALRADAAVESYSNSGGLPCPAAGTPMHNSDTLTIRHIDPAANEPPWQSHAWYVDSRSSEADLPALRRQTLLPDGRMQNQEIMPGVESLRVTRMIDSDADGLGDLLIDSGTHYTGPVFAVHISITVRDRAANFRTTAARLVALRNVLPG